MRRLGLLGGMSWESSVHYERLINEAVRADRGGVASADLLVRSFDFAVIEALQAAGRWDEAADVLAGAARHLVAGGAEGVVICTNTMHRVYDEVAAAVAPVPVLHIADATAVAVREAGVATVGLLGTRFTMEQDFYAARLHDGHGLGVLVPEADDRALVHRVIYDELVRGVVSPSSRAAYQEVV
ncbi:MAG: amino acid racemase, partial [Acidimicrobiales bacterium]|nr:amino acid racemase [Acidimicrobiales bacterium]